MRIMNNVKYWILRFINFISSDPTPPQEVAKVSKGESFPFYIPHKGVYIFSSKLVSILRERKE